MNWNQSSKKGKSLGQMVLGKLDLSCRSIRQDPSLPYILDRNELWMDQESKAVIWCHQTNKVEHKILQGTGIVQEFENIWEVQTIKAEINKWDCIKLRRFCTAKENTQQRGN